MRKSRLSRILVGLCCLLSCFALIPTGHASETVTVDASVVDGIIPAIHGVTNGPVISTASAEEPPCQNSIDADFTQTFIDLQIPQVRFHGGAEVELYLLWKPWPNFIGEDATDPTNYDWTRVDQVVAQAAAASTEIFMRIGNDKNEGCDPSILFLKDPPNDFTVFGEVCKRILMHISDGWDSGTYETLNYVEIWNEFYRPDFWTGTGTQAIQMYEAVYAACKPTFPNILLLPSINTPWGASQIPQDFWQYVIDNNVPIDGVAPHLYATNPFKIEERVFSSSQNKSWEDLFGIVGLPLDTPIFNAEWNRDSYNVGGKGNSVPGASFVAAALIVQADLHPANGPHNLLMSHLFSSRFQIWNADTSPRAPGVGLEAYAMMVNDTPNKLSITGGYTDYANIDFRVIAGKSNDGSLINLLVTYYDTTLDPEPDNNHVFTIVPLTVNINNLPWGDAAFIWERWVHTSNGGVTLEASGNGLGGSFSISQNMNANALEYYQLVGPPSGIWVDFAYNGAESGTESEPFNTLSEGVANVASAGTISIQPGETSETMTINDSMTLVNTNPAGGVVLIGVLPPQSAQIDSSDDNLL